MNTNKYITALHKVLKRIPVLNEAYYHLLAEIAYKNFINDKLTIRKEGQLISEEIKTVNSLFLAKDQNSDTAFRARITKDILYCMFKYGATPTNYYTFGFLSLSEDERSTFVTDIYRRQLLKRISGNEKYLELKDKYGFYKKMSKYFYRDVISIRCEQDFVKFNEFCHKHVQFIAKPNGGTLGKNTNIYSVNNNVRYMFDSFISAGEWIIEELIVQIEEMKQWNPSSVNTIRLNCYLSGSKFYVLCPFMRTGRKGKCVDNGGSGGIFAVVDEKTGEIVTDGFDEYGNCYPIHPDSGLTFKGWKIPFWDQLLMVGEDCIRTLSDHKYVGFDFALTSNGWVLIEGNWGQQIGQICTKKGIKKEFESLLMN